MSFAYNSFRELLDGLEASIQWFESLNLRVSGTRLEQLRELVQSLLNEMESLEPEEVVNRWSINETYYALADSAAFGRIAREMSRVGPNLLPRRKLRTILSGPLDPGAEDPSDESVNARNIFVELELAADLSEKGIQLSGFEDVEFVFGETPIHVECKRLHSQGQVSANINRGVSQLSRDMASDQSRGLIALVLDRIVGVDRLIFREEIEGEQLQAARNVVEDFAVRYRHALQPPIDTRILGFIFIVRFLVYSVPRNLMGTSYNVAFFPYDRLQYRDRRLLESLAQHLSARARSRPWPTASNPPPAPGC